MESVCVVVEDPPPHHHPRLAENPQAECDEVRLPYGVASASSLSWRLVHTTVGNVEAQAFFFRRARRSRGGIMESRLRCRCRGGPQLPLAS